MATDTAQTSTNGALTPPSLPPAPTYPSPAKRKRTDTDTIPNGAPSSVAPANGPPSSLQTVLEDIVTVLQSYDTEPSILEHPITSSAARAASGEADAKRTKLTPPTPVTISSLLKSHSYDSFEALEQDAENVTEDILATIGSSELDAAPSTPEESALQAKVLAFQKMLKTLIYREKVRRAHVDAKKRGSEKGTNGQPDNIYMQAKEEPLESRTVLTLFGSAQGPKQLFSSLQQPCSIPSATPATKLDASIKVTLPLRESTLPNILSTTEVLPLPDGMEEKKKAREDATIGKLFKAPAHLPQLSPPKLAKTLTTKGSTVSFAHPEVPKPSRKGSHSYANQQLSAGYWLGYGGVDMPKDPTSPTAKQKSRQRALSTGAGEQPPSELTLTAVKQAKEDALFRSAYSSFAPTRDNASAIVPEETKNMVWWQKIGEKRFNEVFPVDPELLELDASVETEEEQPEENEDELFKEAVEQFEPIQCPTLELEEKSYLEKSSEEVLADISELLETLASHQRIRNSSLATNPRTPVIQNASLANLAGSPSTPSSEEVDIYQILKAQLTMMILQLPPHALAKLNGDQLEELNISRTILIENKDTRGVLEEDQASRLAKAPTPAATGPPSLSRMTSGGSASHHYSSNATQYGRSAPPAHSTSRPVQASTSYFPQQQAVHRSPSVQYPRASSGPQPSYQTPNPTFAANPRPNYATNHSYTQQTPRAAHAPAPNQYYSQSASRPNNYGGAAASQYYGATPQTQPQARYPQQQQNGVFPPRPQNVPPPMYPSTPNAHARTASPLKAAPTPSVFQPNYASRAASGYGTPISGGPIRNTYYPASQFGNPQPQPLTPVAGSAAAPRSTAATPGYGTNPQQIILNQQQAQAATQPQARLAAQNSFSSRQSSGTPQPGQTNGQLSNGQLNAGSMVS